MRTPITRWFMFGLLLGWALTHATVFGQPAGKTISAADRQRQALDRLITVDFSGGSLTEVLNHIRDRSGLNIKVDEQGLMMRGMIPNGGDGGFQPQFQVKAKDEKASNVLRQFLGGYQLCYLVFEDSILVTTDDLALMRQMKQRVNVSLEDVPANKAIRELAKKHGINLVIDPKVDAATPVSLQVDNTGIETAVRLLAELANLKAVRMGNVVFVTSEEKAKKIRDEEQHQFDNPFNPRSTAIDLPIVGGFGMIGGGAFPGNVPRAFAAPGNPGAPPPPNIDLPKPDDAPPKKVVIPVPQAPRPVPPPGLDRSNGAPPLPAPRPKVD